MNAKAIWVGAIALVGLWGCGGETTGDVGGTVSGVVYDIDGGVVRGARVYAEGVETESNSVGAYVLRDLPDLDLLIRAEYELDGVEYVGVNVARVFADARAKNVSITLIPRSTESRVQGTVRDEFGFRIPSARVFARLAGDSPGALAGVLSSSYAIANDQGEFVLNGLRRDETYILVANTLDTDTDEVEVEITSSLQTVDFIVGDGTDPALPAPSGFDVLAWTAPTDTTRNRALAQAVEGVKRTLDPDRARRAASRTTSLGNEIEIDLTWDRLDFNSVLGFGIYRGTSSVNIPSLESLRDPLAEIFSDQDGALRAGTTYYYQVAGLTTSFDEFGNGIGARTSVRSARPLDDLLLNDVQADLRPTFFWRRLNNAEDYAVLVYDEYPGLYSRPLNSTEWTTGTSWRYPTELAAGERYWFLVVARSESDDARSVSEVRSFVPAD